jgi:hypothetical protein
VLRTDDVDLRLKSLDADEHMGPEELYLLDAVHDISGKLKKAFCEPQNTSFCPPLALAKQVRAGCVLDFKLKHVACPAAWSTWSDSAREPRGNTAILNIEKRRKRVFSFCF